MIKLKSLLPEQNVPTTEFTLDRLSFQDIVKAFPKHYNQTHFTRMQPDGQEGPYYKDAVAFPTPSDESRVIGDMESFEDWKDETKRRFGNITIVIDPNAEHYDMVKIEDDKFKQSKQQADQAKADALRRMGTTQ